MVRTACTGLWRFVVGLFEHRSEPLGPIKGGEFLDYLGNYQRLKRTGLSTDMLT